MSRYTCVNIYIMFPIYNVCIYVISFIRIEYFVGTSNIIIMVINSSGEETGFTLRFHTARMDRSLPAPACSKASCSSQRFFGPTQNHKRRPRRHRKVWGFQGFFSGRSAKVKMRKICVTPADALGKCFVCFALRKWNQGSCLWKPQQLFLQYLRKFHKTQKKMC